MIRWALKVKWNSALTGSILLGPLYWAGGEPGPTRTFATREEARQAKCQLRGASLQRRARPVKVLVTIKEEL